MAFIPTHNHFFDMTPSEFEQRSLEILSEQLKGVENLEIKHNSIIRTDDGNYQIDGIIQFEVMGVQYKTIVECKHYSSPISRDKVQILYDKIRAIGAHKGILISTSNFQSGALEYARKHGIALIQISEAVTKYEMRGMINIIQPHSFAFNYGLPYIGIMQESTETGIACNYLLRDNQHLKEFMLGMHEWSQHGV